MVHTPLPEQELRSAQGRMGCTLPDRHTLQHCAGPTGTTWPRGDSRKELNPSSRSSVTVPPQLMGNSGSALSWQPHRSSSQASPLSSSRAGVQHCTALMGYAVSVPQGGGGGAMEFKD
jgi:hypothetical protein